MKKFRFITLLLTLFVLAFSVGCLNNSGNGKDSVSDSESLSSSIEDSSSSVNEIKYYSAVKDCTGIENGGEISLDGSNYSVKSSSTFRFNRLEIDGEIEGNLNAFVFYLKDKENLTIDGNGSTLTLLGDVSLVYLENCKNVTVKNFNIEYGEEIVGAKSVTAFVNNSSSVNFENIKLTGGSNGFYVQNSQNFLCDGMEYLATEAENNGVFLITANCEGSISVKNSKALNLGGILKQYANADFEGSADVSFVGNEFRNFSNGLNLNVNCKIDVSDNIFDGVLGSTVKNDGGFLFNERDYALTFNGNAVKNSSGTVIDLALEKTDGGNYKIIQISVANNEFSALSGEYIMNIGEVSRMLNQNNVSDGEFQIKVGAKTKIDDGTNKELVALAIGDSITYGAIMGANGQWTTVENTYFDLVCDRIGATEKHNYGISGTCITYYNKEPHIPANDALVRRAGLLVDGDVVFIAIGTNDFGCAVPLGKEGDTVETTLWGATELSFATIAKNNPGAEVYVILPIKRGDCDINKIGKTLEDYTYPIRKTAHKYGFKTIEGSNFIINPFDPVHRENYIEDLVHPNQAAHYYYAQMVIDGMEERTTTPVAFKEIVGEIMAEDSFTIETVLQNPDASLTWESFNENVATVSDGVVTGVNSGRTIIIATDEDGNQAVFICKVTPKAGNNDVYLALSKTIGDETTSVLYTTAGGPYRCDYIYAPSSSFIGDNNAIKFNVTVKQSDGYFFIIDGTNNDVSTAWGAEGRYVMGAAIGKDYCGTFTCYSGGSTLQFANSSMLKIKDLSNNADLTGKNIDWEVGKTYEITYRLAKGHALSFFYTKSVYDTNGSAICWARWNTKLYCYDVLDSLTFSNFSACNMEGSAMTARTETFTVDGYTATVLIPANANGKWLWKTEYFYAFDAVELALYNQGYTRAYFEISYKFGSPKAVDLMYKFYKEMMDRYDLDEKAYMLGFSVGALYAFNFTLAHPECVEKVHLDAPVLDLRSWPRTDPKYNEIELHKQVLTEYGFKSEEEFLNYGAYPVDKFNEYFALNIPTLLIAGDSDTTVAFSENSARMIDYCNTNGVDLAYYVKMGADHHPHAFGRVSTYDFAYPATFKVYSSEIENSSSSAPVTVDNEVSVITWFYK